MMIALGAGIAALAGIGAGVGIGIAILTWNIWKRSWRNTKCMQMNISQS